LTLFSKDIILDEELNNGFGFWIRASNLIASAESKFQKIELFSTPKFGKVLRIDNYFMTSEKDEFFYHENMVHPAMLSHPNPKKILIIGGGDGGAAKEYLRHPSVEKIIIAEIDSVVIDFCKKHLSKVHDDSFSNSKVEVKICDGKKFIEESTDQFDIILLDLTDPFGPSEMLYRIEFLAHCKRLLGDLGILTMHVGSPIARPELYHRLVSSAGHVFKTVRPYQTYVPLYGTSWGMLVASNSLDPIRLSKKEISILFEKRNLRDLNYLNAENFNAVFNLPNYIKKILSKPFRPISKNDPLTINGIDPEDHIQLDIKIK
jgi:spermidine synthase